MPRSNPEVYAAERPAPGVRGSYLAYRSDTYHRGAPFGSGTGARIVAALAFKNAATEWIGYDTQQSRSTGTEWTTFVEGRRPGSWRSSAGPPPATPSGTSGSSRGPRSAIPVSTSIRGAPALIGSGEMPAAPSDS